MGDDAVQALAALRDSLLADIPLARTREEHIRVTARASAAERILTLAANGGKSPHETASEPTHSLTETQNLPPPVN